MARLERNSSKQHRDSQNTIMINGGCSMLVLAPKASYWFNTEDKFM
jgi:hypothetical protein